MTVRKKKRGKKQPKEAAKLKGWALRIVGVPPEIWKRQPGGKLPELFLSDIERLQLGNLLYRLSEPQKETRGRRPDRAVAGRQNHIALDYQLTKQRHTSSNSAVIEVGDAWYRSGKTQWVKSKKGTTSHWTAPGKRVLEAYGKSKMDTGWQHWAKLLMKQYEDRHDELIHWLRSSLSHSA